MIEHDDAGCGFVLGSGSPRRRAMLFGAGLRPQVHTADIDETPATGEGPLDFTTRMAREKALAVAARLGRPTLGCDTTVIVDGDILGKPVDDADAVAMLRRLAGRSHDVISAWAIAGPTGVLRAGHGVTGVRFLPLAAGQIEAYVATGEPRDKAGAYGIQGLGMRLIGGYSGDYPTVVGMPLGDVLDGLAAEGLIPQPASAVARRLAILRGRIAAGCDAAGRDPRAVTLVGASKAQPAAKIRAALAAGLRDFGESYVQEWQAKAAEWSDGQAPAPRWHFIGRVQRNKARHIAEAALVHGVYAARTAEALGKRAGGRSLPILVQVDLAGEASKGGVAPDDLAGLLDDIAGIDGVRVDGLMTLPPHAGLAAARARFAELRALRDALATHERPLSVLSMGMSGDFDAAIAEGATHVRIGTALFGPRG